LLAREILIIKKIEQSGCLLCFHADAVEDANVRQQGLNLPYKIQTEYQFTSDIQIGGAGAVVISLPPGVAPVSSIT
jgi:hypothetical protein